MKLVTIAVSKMQELLANQTNRNLNQNRVRLLAHEMEQGKWNPAIAPVLLYTDGTLADGQHRLAAAVMRGKPLQVWLATIDRQEITKVDSGMNRTTYMHSQILGLTVTKADLAAARVAICLHGKSFGLSPRVNHDDLIQAARRYDVVRFRYRYSVLSGACAYIHSVSAGVPEFFRMVVTGEMLARTEPAFHLRNALLLNPAGGNYEREELLVKTVKAWNAYAAGEQMGTLKAPKRPFEWMDIVRKEAKDGHAQAD